MSEWKEYKFEDITTEIGDGIHGTPIYSEDGEFYFINGNNISNGKVIIKGDTKRVNQIEFEKYKKPLSDRTILLSINGTIGNVGFYNNEKCILGKSACYFNLKDNVDKHFVYYTFLADNFQSHLLNIATGTTIQNVPLKGLRESTIMLPPLDEQKRIASIFSSLDDKIDLLNRENATLEAMAETLFRQWFIEEAKEDWEEGKLGNYVNETVSGEWGKENPEGDFIKPVQCIRGTDIADLNIGLATKTPIRFIKESKFDKIEPNNGDIIMEISGGTENQSTGRVTFINEDVKALFDYPIIFSNFCRLLRIKEECTYFIYCYLRYLYNQDELFNLENGSSGIKNLDYKALLYELSYPMPNEKRQILDFNNKVRLYFDKINRNKQQIQTLIHTRDILLPKLMSNEIQL